MPPKGYKNSEEFKQKMSLLRGGKLISEEILNELYDKILNDSSVLGIMPLVKKFGFGSKTGRKVILQLYEKYGRENILSIVRTRQSHYRLKIRNSKKVRYSNESKKRMSKALQEAWKRDDGSRRKKMQRSMIENAWPKARISSTRLKAVETRFKNNPNWLTDETRIKISKSNLGRIVSEETRKKQRISAIKRIQKSHGQIHPNYNKDACKLFDEINKHFQWLGQHAENGGEFYIDELGYWVDYYEPILNIVIEFDEKSHKRSQKKEKDKKRQFEIEQILKCKVLRIENINFEEIKNCLVHWLKN